MPGNAGQGRALGSLFPATAGGSPSFNEPFKFQLTTWLPLSFYLSYFCTKRITFALVHKMYKCMVSKPLTGYGNRT